MAITTNPWLTVPLFVLGFGFVFILINAPLTYYSGFVLPHRYGTSHQALLAWIWDQIKELTVAGVVGLIILEILYWLLRLAPTTWWIWIALFMFAFTILLSNLAPIILFPIFYKFVTLDNQELKSRLISLAQRADTNVKGVYTFDESRKSNLANAALTGLGSTRRIILADTLTENFSNDEIEVVLAHELGHHVHGDLGKGILIESFLTLGGFWIASLVMNWGVEFFGFESVADPAGFPLLVLALSLYGLITMPLGNLWSRWRERMADNYALRSTQMPDAFISAMTRLANQNLAEVEPPAWVEFLLHSHPSIHKRVAMAEYFRSAH